MGHDKAATKSKPTNGNELKAKKTITKAAPSALVVRAVPAPTAQAQVEAATELAPKTEWNQKTGVFFRYPRLRSFIQSRIHGHNIVKGAEVPFADFLAYICVQLVRDSAKLAHTQKMHTITPRHVMLAKAANPELDRLIGPCIIADSGAVPYLPVPFRSKGEQQRLKKKDQLLLTQGSEAPLALEGAPAEKKTEEERAELKAQKIAARAKKLAARETARIEQEKAAEEAKGLKKAAAKIAAAKEKRAAAAAAAEKPSSKSKAKVTEKPAAKAKKQK